MNLSILDGAAVRSSLQTQSANMAKAVADQIRACSPRRTIGLSVAHTL